MVAGRTRINTLWQCVSGWIASTTPDTGSGNKEPGVLRTLVFRLLQRSQLIGARRLATLPSAVASDGDDMVPTASIAG